MKYAVIFINGTQKILTPFKYLDINLSIKTKVNDYICFNKTLLLRKRNFLSFGTPYIKNCFIIAKIIEKYKSKKMLILRNKPKKNYSKRKGYRKLYYRLYTKI